MVSYTKEPTWEPKSEIGILLSFYENSQYKLWIPSLHVAVLARDVAFVEEKFSAKDWNEEEEAPPLLQEDEAEPPSTTTGTQVSTTGKNTSTGPTPENGGDTDEEDGGVA